MEKHIPNLRHLRAFQQVAVCKSISQASKIIFLSQPAITQAIAKLEATLGVPVFERRREGMFLTEAGEILFTRVDQALSLLNKGVKEALVVAKNKMLKSHDTPDRLITTVQLRALLAVAISGNFSLAARSVGVTQPSLHRAARDLETLLGIPLFRKARHGIAMTEASAPLVLSTKLAFSELGQAVAEIAEWRGIETNEIVIGTMPLARSYVLPSAINEYISKYPETRIRVVDGPYDDLLYGLRHGDIDFLMGALRTSLPVSDIVQMPLFDESLAIVWQSQHPLAKKGNITTSDLMRYPWVIPREGTPMRSFFEDWLVKENVTGPTGVIETSSLSLLRSLLLDSDRIGLVSTHQIILEEKLGLLKSMPFQEGITCRPIGLTLRKDWRPTRRQTEFLDLMKNQGN